MEENSAPQEIPIPVPPAVIPETLAPTLCPQCHQPVSPDAVFCPNCGKQLKDKQLSTTVFTQISLYVFALFLPPLGFWPGVKYYRNSDPKAQEIGMWLILISIASTIITIWLTFVFLNVYLSTFSSVLSGTGGLN